MNRDDLIDEDLEDFQFICPICNRVYVIDDWYEPIEICPHILFVAGTISGDEDIFFYATEEFAKEYVLKYRGTEEYARFVEGHSDAAIAHQRDLEDLFIKCQFKPLDEVPKSIPFAIFEAQEVIAKLKGKIFDKYEESNGDALYVGVAMD